MADQGKVSLQLKGKAYFCPSSTFCQQWYREDSDILRFRKFDGFCSQSIAIGEIRYIPSGSRFACILDVILRLKGDILECCLERVAALRVRDSAIERRSNVEGIEW